MIVQFLNGNQLVVDTLEGVHNSILTRVAELGLDDILFSSQINLTPTDDPNLLYAFIRPVSEVTFQEMSRELANIFSKEDRCKLITTFIQRKADARQISFSATRGRYYEIYDTDQTLLSGVHSSRWWNEWDFAHPKNFVTNPVAQGSQEDGKMVYDHWLRVNEEYYAISTVVYEEDLD